MTVAVAVAVVLCIDVADFLPKRSSYFCVCVRLCVLVYPTRRDANIILTFYTPRPSTNAWVSLCFERSVERDTLQYHPNTAEVTVIGIQFPKACSETIIFFSYSISSKKSVSTFVHESQQLNYRRRIAQTPWQTHAHLARYSFDILARLYRICSIVHVCIHALCILILYFIQYRLVGCASQSVFAHTMIIFLY